jgi:hypothetical protein
MAARQPIRIVLPDTGPLISLALADALDLLLMVAPDVRIVLTDVVHHEATHRHQDLPDAQAIQAFLVQHHDRVEIMPTTIGSMALGDIRRRLDAGQEASLPKDLGELSITNFVMSLRRLNPGDPMLVIIEDDWFAENAYAVPGNVHLLSTSAWLDGLERLGLIESAAAIRIRIQAARPHFRSGFMVDQQAPKVDGGTEWTSSFMPGAR